MKTWVSQVLTETYSQWSQLNLGQESYWWAHLTKPLSSGSFHWSLSEPQVFVQSLPESELLEPTEFAETCKDMLLHEKFDNENPCIFTLA